MSAIALIKRFIPLRTRNAIRVALKRHPIEYRSRWPDLAMFNLAKNDVVFDVGANVGEFTECVLAFQPRAIVHAFEPIPEVFRELALKFKDYSGIYLNPAALGSRPGEQSLIVSSYAEASSFLENGPVLNEGVYGIDFGPVRSQRVNVETLADYCVGRGVGLIRLLKLDVQGYELEVLKGADAVLDRVEFVYAEAQFQELYKGGPRFTDLFDFLNIRSFDLVRMTSFRKDDEGRLMECDMIFRNRALS